MNNLVLLASHEVYSRMVQACDPKDFNCIIDDPTNAGTFGVVQTVFTAMGIGVAIFTVWRVIKALITGKIPEAAKNFVGGLIASAFCFNIRLPLELVAAVGKVFEKVFDTISGLIG